MIIPTPRTLRKFGRDLLVAIITAAVVFLSDNVADLGMSPEISALLVTVVALVWRSVRGYLGSEPQDG